MRIELADIQRRQHLATLRARGDWQLVLAQVRQFAVQPIVATRTEPLRGILSVAVLRAEVQLDRQFQVMHAVAIAQQHVQLAQGVTLATDRHVGGNQLDPRRMLHGELPESLIIKAQAAGTGLGQPVQQAVTVPVEFSQPVFQLFRGLHPVAAGQRMTLWPGRGAEHRRGEDDPRQVAHFGVAQLVG